ncbi:MAG: N-acetyl-gamma-glutamyl-phosphate reductase [Alphaproteobacteria bacterium]|nr:MAG: N-acetyl-gamma-glutamyl-phosphate reductase [Alphaproteobacteria bacterium]
MTRTRERIRIGILGASGYTGADLVRLLAPRRDVEIALLTAERQRGKSIERVFPQFAGLDLPDLIGLDEVEWPALDLDVVFCALPHATSQEVIRGLLHATRHSLLDELMMETLEDMAASVPRSDLRIIDLSADFRLADPKTYEEWYGRPHQAPDLQPRAIYGLSEWNREAIRDARLVACPGCYPTAVLLALLPLIAGQDGPLIDPEHLVIDAKSGVSGAGRSLKPEMLFAEVAESLRPYGVGRHRHMPEMEQELSRALGRAVEVSFTPHLVPMNRGELVTCHLKLAAGATVADLRKALAVRYADEPFVHVPSDDHVPATRDVRGSNRAVINAFPDRRAGHAIVIAAIDNLVKGSSGQAIQNMNLMLGLPENQGLEACPIFP